MARLVKEPQIPNADACKLTNFSADRPRRFLAMEQSYSSPKIRLFQRGLFGRRWEAWEVFYFGRSCRAFIRLGFVPN